MSMDKYFAKSQLAKIALIVAFLLIAPLLSTSMRPPFLYILFNLLIILLGAESGVLRGFSSPPSPPDDKKPAAVISSAVAPAEAVSNKSGEQATTCSEGLNKGEEKNAAAAKLPRVKKCLSTPSLFFIGGSEAEHFEEEDVGGDELEGRELFAKAEMFIGNFYKQLKIQREESWKKIHGLYQRAF